MKKIREIIEGVMSKSISGKERRELVSEILRASKLLGIITIDELEYLTRLVSFAFLKGKAVQRNECLSEKVEMLEGLLEKIKSI